MKKVKKYLHIALLATCLAALFCTACSAEGGTPQAVSSAVGGASQAISSAKTNAPRTVSSAEINAPHTASLAEINAPRTTSSAQSDDVARESTEELLSDFSLILPDGMKDLANDPTGSIGFDSLLSELLLALRGEMPSAVLFLFLLIGAAVLLALVANLGDGVAPAVRSGVAVAVGCVILLRLFPLLTAAATAVREVGEFFALLVPILVGGAALGGGAVAASSGAGMSLTLSFIGGAASLIFPLVGATVILAVVATLAPDLLANPLDTVRKNLIRAFGIATAVISGLFALQTSVAAARDGATVRALKYAVNNSIPVVGGAVSGTLSTLVGGLGYAMGIIGGGGVAVMLSIALSPLVKLLLYRFAFFVVGIFLDCFPTNEGTRCINAIAGGLDALIAVLSLSVAVYLLEAVVVMKGVVSFL